VTFAGWEGETVLLKSNASAKRTRRRLILFSLPVVLLALFVAWKLLSMPLLAQRGIDAYDQGRFESSVEASDSLMFLNVAETWIPYFNRGTAHAAGQAYSDATDDLAKALERAPQERRCDVRVNLALAWELQGDSYFQAGYFTGAIKLYETAKAVLDAGADEGCFEQQPSEGRNEQQPSPREPDETAERLQQADERVAEKLRQSEQQEAPAQPEADAGQPGEANGGAKGKVDELKERSDEAEKEKQNQDSTQRGQDGSRDYVEKPW
jgi:tetratricopeptide (TPR) repeat protein